MTSRQRGGIIFKLIFAVSFVALCLAVYLARHPILRAMGNFWVVEDSLEPADAIVILSDDNFQADRATRAAELYRARWAPSVVASGKRLRPYAGIAELMRRDLAERGVPAEAIVQFSHTAENTREEAQALRRLVAERGWRRLLVVTSNYHTRRARYIFHRVMPEDLRVRLAAARDSDFDPDHWWQTRLGLKLFFRETLGICWAIWELRHSTRDSGGSDHVPGPAPSPAPAPSRP